MLDSLITSKTRVKLLLKFFSNSQTKAYLRGLAQEFGESTNSVRLELNRMSKAGLLNSESNGNTKLYQANIKHPLFPELNKLVTKYLGFDQIVIEVIQKLGDLELALITGDYASGKDTGIVDLVLVGDIDWHYLVKLIKKAEDLANRKIRPLVLSMNEFKKLGSELKADKAMVLWTKDEAHAAHLL